MLHDLSNPYDTQRFKSRVEKMLTKQAIVDLTEKKPTRSLSQNAYLHLILGYFAAEFGYSLDEVKIRFFKQLVNQEIFQEQITNRRGKTILRLRSSASLTTQELSTAIERFRNWSAVEAGLYLPSAEDHQLQIFAQQEIDRSKNLI